jgi:polyhydroxyalkanoate synthesis regulator phasin
MNKMENFSSQADNQNLAFENTQSIKDMVAQDIRLIENLVQTGVMTQEQGHNLVNYVTQKAFEKYTSVQTPTAQDMVAPEFFNQEGRSDVFDYLKNANVNFDDDEISKISSLVEKIENSAIDRYERAKNHEKTLNSENESAKQRLRANAQNTVSDGTKNLVFTREQIGKMSGAEFAKHERAIMDQLKKGLIR